jgi:tRNA G26 N,N-dimethylase Trm1
MERLLESLTEMGHAAARYPDLEPMLVTDAPFDDVVQAVKKARDSTD